MNVSNEMVLFICPCIRNKEQQEWKIEIRRFEERMENLREELRKERDKSHKKTTKDLVEVCWFVSLVPSYQD